MDGAVRPAENRPLLLDPSIAVDRILAMARDHLGMDVAFVSEWKDGQQVFRHLAGPAETFGVHHDEGSPLEGSYCLRVMDGRLPNVVSDAFADPVASELPVTHEQRIGSYIGVPVRFSDGHMYGMLCCISHTAEPSLNARDTQLLSMLAEVVAERLEMEQAASREASAKMETIRRLMSDRDYFIVFQPIVELVSGFTIGYEALARFTASPVRPPNEWFSEAASVGLGVELELATAASAAEQLHRIPEPAYLSINFSPRALVDERVGLLLRAAPHRFVAELTEHVQVEDYVPLRTRLGPLQRAGLRLAVDDTGAGYASLQHIIQLSPQVIKVDLSLTRSVDADPARRAVVASMARFAEEIGAKVVAEGIETADELNALRKLGIHYGQGYLLGRPGPLPAQPAVAAGREEPLNAVVRRA